MAAQFAQPHAGFMQRGFEFQMILAQMRDFLGLDALVAAPREAMLRTCCTRTNATTPDSIATGQPMNRASAAPKRGADKEQAEGQKRSGDGGDSVGHASDYHRRTFPMC